jgi:NACHT domain- and WD repeat-containing protein
MTAQVFRVFVSSTFVDMKAERAALQERVFPQLREACAARGARFQPIDLRWGVSDAAARDQQTMHICLSEIDRCAEASPTVFFVALIGDRYGWRPLPHEVAADDFQRIRTHTRGKTSRSLLDYWYRRDDNAAPPVFILRERTDEFTDRVRWRPVEIQLLSIFKNAVARLRLSRASRLNYTASATEQEIERGLSNIARAGRSRASGVFVFIRNIEDLPTDHSVSGYRDVDEHGEPDLVARDQLNRLKARLRRRLPGQVHEYRTRWHDGAVSPQHLDKLCNDIYSRLLVAIETESARRQNLSPLEREVIAHDRFGEQRSSVFVGRTDALDLIRKELRKTSLHPLIISGPGGSGKTTLMARAVHAAKQRGIQPIVRYLGATSESSDGRLLLKSLCLQIADQPGFRRVRLPDDFNGLAREFGRSIQRASVKKPLVIYLDALDQLADAQSRALDWLPASLPAGVHLIASTLPGECLDALRHKLPTSAFVNVEPMSKLEGNALLDAWLDEAGRSLLPEQREDLLKNFANHGLPLYLKLAFEEASRWHSFDGLPTGADQVPGLAPDVTGILKDLFWRLSLDGNHGPTLVERSLGYLAAGRQGLSEDELLDVMSSDASVMEDFRLCSPESPPTQNLPLVVWSRLRFDLAPYLAERSADGASTISFYHRQLREVVVDQFLNGPARLNHHQHLAGYFSSQPFENGQGAKRVWNLRKLGELAFQQTHAEEWSSLRKTLTGLTYLDAKVSAVGPYPLIDDFDLALQERKSLPGEMAGELELVQDALRLSAHILTREPRELASQLCARLAEQSELIDGLSPSERKMQSGSWLRPYSSGLTPAGSPLRQTFAGPISSNHVVVTPDGRLAICSDDDWTLWIFDLQANILKQELKTHREWMTAAAMHPDQPLAAFGSEKGEIWWIDPILGRVAARSKSDNSDIEGLSFIRNGASLSLVAAHKAGTLVIHDLPPSDKSEKFEVAEELGALAIGPDKRCYCGAGNRVIVWDAELKRPSTTLSGHNDQITSLAVSPDGRAVAAGYDDGSLEIWNDLVSPPIALAGHREQPTRNEVSALRFTRDGQRLVSVSWDEKLRIWDRASGKQLGRFTGHSSSVYGLDLVPNTELAVTVSKDGTMRVWDLTRVSTADQRSRHDAAIDAVAISTDWAVSGSRDRTLWLWELKTGAPVRRWVAHKGTEPHEGWITTVALDAAGEFIYSGGQDSTLRSWKLADGSELKVTKGDWESLAGLELSADGSVMLVADNEYTQTAAAVWRPGRSTKVGIVKPKVFGGGKVAVSTDGQWGLVADLDGMVSLVDVRRLRRVWTLQTRGSRDRISAMAFSPDGALALLGYEKGRLQLRRLKDRRLIWTIRAHSDQIAAVSVSPDGQLGCSAGWDRALHLWDMRDRSLVTSFSSDDFWSSCRFAPDSRTIVAGDERGCLHFLQLEGVL